MLTKKFRVGAACLAAMITLAMAAGPLTSGALAGKPIHKVWAGNRTNPSTSQTSAR
jgi:hypothetical protein